MKEIVVYMQPECAPLDMEFEGCVLIGSNPGFGGEDGETEEGGEI